MLISTNIAHNENPTEEPFPSWASLTAVLRWWWCQEVLRSLCSSTACVQSLPFTQTVTSPVGVTPPDKRIYPFDKRLEEGTSAVFCCVPPPGVNITSMTFNNMTYPLISFGARVKAIAVASLTIPSSQVHIVGCRGTTGSPKYSLNYMTCEFELLFCLH